MANHSTRILMLLGALVLLTVASGCSIIGVTAGAIIDANTPDESRYSALGLDSIDVGSAVTVIRKDSSHVEGKFAGLEELAPKDYAAAYDRYRLSSPLGHSLPAVGDSIRIISRGLTGRRGTTEALFEGFGPEGVRFFLQRTPQRGHAQVAFVDTIYTAGGIVPGEQLRQGLEAGGIPLIIKELRVNAMSGDPVLIPLDEVLEVKKENAHSAKFVMLAMGAAVDIVIIAAVASSKLGPFPIFEHARLW